MVKVLLENNAQVDLQNKEGWSSLIVASILGHTGVVKVLLENNAHVDFQNKMQGLGFSLMYASFCGWNDVVQLLLGNDAQVDLKDDEGWSSLMAASLLGHTDVVKG